jgi:hypothetical protein
MADKTFVIQLPEDLLERANAAHIDLRQLFIDTLKQNLPAENAEITQILQQRLPAARADEALKALRNGERILGLHAGVITVRDDFDDPLPDSFWLTGDL